jgi:hypothetical protein
MKTRTLIMACLLLGIGLTRLSAQGDTRTISYNVEWPIYVLLEDNSVVLEEIYGYIEYHVREHYVNGELKWLKASCHGEVTNEYTGEVFWINELNKSMTPFEAWDGYWWVQDNIKGSQGSHYILFSLWYYPTLELIESKLIIPGN